MRERKFRAWDKLRGCMVRAEDVSFESDGVAFLLWVTDAPLDSLAMIACGPYELMQFTGLCDSQGHEIYEGDILRLIGEKEMLAVVEFANGAFKARSYLDSVAWLDMVLAIADESEVVGNRFENPEMLEEVLQGVQGA